MLSFKIFRRAWLLRQRAASSNTWRLFGMVVQNRRAYFAKLDHTPALLGAECAVLYWLGHQQDGFGNILGDALKPWELLGETRAPDGTLLALMRHDREFVLLANGKPLMSSRMHGSEEALATIVCRRARTSARPCVLVGGLGMGFTLRATLDALPPEASIIVAELVPAVVEWNREVLAPLADHPLQDRRVEVIVGDVADTLASSRDRFDALLLDVDNGPEALTASANDRLYSDAGLVAIGGALTSGGVVGVWSARDDRKFEQRLRFGGFNVGVERVRARGKKGGPLHTIFLGSKRVG